MSDDTYTYARVPQDEVYQVVVSRGAVAVAEITFLDFIPAAMRDERKARSHIDGRLLMIPLPKEGPELDDKIATLRRFERDKDPNYNAALTMIFLAAMKSALNEPTPDAAPPKQVRWDVYPAEFDKSVLRVWQDLGAYNAHQGLGGSPFADISWTAPENKKIFDAAFPKIFQVLNEFEDQVFEQYAPTWAELTPPRPKRGKAAKTQKLET